MAASSTLQELETAMLAEASLGLTSANLTRHEMGPTPNAATCIREYTGLGDETGFGVAGIQTEHPRVQVEQRGEPDDYDGPRLKLEKIRQWMTTIQATELSGTKWDMVVAVGSPQSLGKDGESRPRFVQNFQIDKAPSRTA